MTATGLKRRLLRDRAHACRLAHEVVCISPSLREVLIAEDCCPPGKITVLEHGSIDGVEADGKFDPAGVSAHGGAGARSPSDSAGAPVIGFRGTRRPDKA